MSEYGRLWQKASDLRGEIVKILERPLPKDFRPADVRGRIEAAARLIEQWEAMEVRMKATDD